MKIDIEYKKVDDVWFARDLNTGVFVSDRSKALATFFLVESVEEWYEPVPENDENTLRLDSSVPDKVAEKKIRDFTRKATKFHELNRKNAIKEIEKSRV